MSSHICSVTALLVVTVKHISLTLCVDADNTKTKRMSTIPFFPIRCQYTTAIQNKKGHGFLYQRNVEFVLILFSCYILLLVPFYQFCIFVDALLVNIPAL